MKKTPILLALITLTLAACAPTTGAPAGPSVTQVVESVHYYPRTAGITRQYQAANQSVTIGIDEVGPTTRQGTMLHATRVYGGGENTTTYRTYSNRGAFIHFEDTPSHTTRYDPPLHEYPAKLEPGVRWGGETTATLHFPSDNLTEQVNLEYTYTVLERRNVVINDMNLEVFVINLEAQQDGRWLSQEHWYTPYLGVVRTHNNQFLTGTNLPLPRRVN